MAKYKILYLTWKVPFPANNGGEIGLKNHILELENSIFRENITMFLSTNKMVDVPLKNVKCKLFKQRDTAWKGYLYKLINIIFQSHPMQFKHIATKELCKDVNAENWDVIILDSLNACLALPKQKNYKLIYIAHNIEKNFYFDYVKTHRNFLKKIGAYITAMKIKKLENQVLERADKIICVSTSDFQYFSKMYHDKTVLCGTKINIKDTNETRIKNTLFFCGPMDFPPNLEAANWLANTLAPKLPDITFIICGKNSIECSEKWNNKNVKYLGFVSQEKLEELYKTSTAYICPIIYGSGIKIKITEALSYSMPVIATKEALEGLQQINITPLIDRNNINQTITNINQLIRNNQVYEEFKKQLISNVKDFSQKREGLLEKHIQNLFEGED